MVKLIIDSGSDISQKEAEELGIIVVPIEVQFEDGEYLDGVTLLPDEFYEKLTKCKELPHTSLINEYRWNEAFEAATKDGSDAVAVVLSSKLSGTYKAAVDAAAKYNGKVQVVDSLSATLGERVLGIYALNLIKEGKSAIEIAAALEEKKTKLHVYAMIDTLKYLKKGGRISATTAFFGELLSIKPIAGVIDGEVKVLGKEKGIKKASQAIENLVNKNGGIDFSMPYGTLWTGNDKSLLEKFIEEKSSLWSEDSQNIAQHIMGCTIGTHIGPGAFGIVFFEK